MEKGSPLIVRLTDSLLEALGAGDRERLLACSREAVTALRKPARSTLEKELAELLSSIAADLVSALEAGQILEAGQAEDSSRNQLSLYQDLLSHVKAMAHQKP